MKKYKFKLQPLLKLREFKEEIAKVELGRVNKKIQDAEDKIMGHQKDIDEAYESQHANLNAGKDLNFLQFYPYFITNKQNAIKALEDELVELRKLAEEKMKEMLQRRNEVKVMDKLKEKDFTKFRKEQTKIANQKIEENVQMWWERKGGES